ncbi:MAG: ABC transporter permease [Vicinamibacterales bacterium]
MKLAVRILRLAMPASKAEALAGDLAEDLARRWRPRAVREVSLVMLAIGYAAIAAATRAARPPVDALDVKLALRMLVKYPGLTVIAFFSMAVAIAFGAGAFAIHSFLYPRLPLPGGDRIVSIENVDTRYRNDDRQVLHDFAIWQSELETLTDLGAYVDIRRNLLSADGRVDAMRLAQMSAAGFRIAGASPIKGRTLEDRDERPGAEPVLVIGEAMWRRVFGADPAIIGRTVHLGATVHTVVGVMPERFAFPVNHQLWVPFRLDPGRYARGQSPDVNVFARLSPGASLDAAKAEIAVLGERLAQQFPESNQHLRPRIVPYTSVFADFDDIDQLYVMQVAVVMLLVVIAVNVAILVYARTVTRAGEIAMRTALGASRRRIVTQLFVEAGALSAAAAVLALGILQIVFVQIESVLNAFMPGGEAGVPFWMDFSLSPRIVLNTAGLAVIAAAIAGVIPALKVTGRHVQAGLQSLATRGSGLRLGKGWTALVVGQVAITAALLPGAAVMAFSSLKFANADPGFAADEYLVADFGLDPEPQPDPAGSTTRVSFDTRFLSRQAELIRRLESEPGVSAVTHLWTMPGREPNMRITLENGGPIPGEERPGQLIRFNRVDANYFRAFDATRRAGRGFANADARPESTAVIVNQHFVDRFFGGAQPLGRRIQYVPNAGPGPAQAQDGTELPGAYEIVGVVSNAPARELSSNAVNARVYHPLTAETYQTLAVRMDPSRAAAMSQRVRDIAVAIDPAFRVNRTRVLQEVYQLDQTEERWGAMMLAGVTLSVLVLAGGGIYALMSVTVSRRRREIGIRAALGGEPRRILAAIFGRALMLLAAGALIGIVPATLLLRAEDMVGGPVSTWEIALLHVAPSCFCCRLDLRPRTARRGAACASSRRRRCARTARISRTYPRRGCSPSRRTRLTGSAGFRGGGGAIGCLAIS